jgi:hypothetical protein
MHIPSSLCTGVCMHVRMQGCTHVCMQVYAPVRVCVQGQQCRGRNSSGVQGEESSSSRGKRSRERGRGRKSKSGKEKRGKSGARAVVRERACKGGGGGERSRCRSRVGASRFASCADAQCVLASLRAQRLTSLSSDTGTMVCIGTPPIRVRRFSLRELC